MNSKPPPQNIEAEQAVLGETVECMDARARGRQDRRQPGENHQIIIRDGYNSIIFEVHFENKILGGFNYIRQEHLSARECQTLVKELYHCGLI